MLCLEYLSVFMLLLESLSDDDENPSSDSLKFPF